MPIRDPNETRYISLSEGVDNTTAVDDPSIKGTISVGDNTDLVDNFLAKKRGGYQPITTWGTRNLRAGLEFKNINGLRQNLLYGESTSLTGNSGILGSFTGTATPTTIVSNLIDGVKPSIIQFRSLAFIFNSRDSLLYDGNSGTTRQIGINPPNSAPTFITNIPGDKVISGSYLLAYSYYNTQTGAESDLSPYTASLVAGATSSLAGFRISLVAGDSTMADKIRIYSSVSGGNVVFRETEIAISSTSYDSTLVDSGLGTEAELDNGRLTEPGRFAILSDDRVFVGGFPSNLNRLQYSKVGISGPMPESYQALDFVDCNINDGDKIVGLGLARSSVIVVKERSVGRLINISASTGGLERQGSQKYKYEEISSETTGLSQDLIISLDGLVIWMGRDDIYGTDGSQIYRFGKRVRNTIKNLDFNQISKWSSIVKTDTQQILFSVTKSGKIECDYQFVAHYRNFPRVAITFYTAGPNTTTHPGLVVGCFFRSTVAGITKTFFGSSDGTGIVHQMDISDNDNGLGIYWDMRLPWNSAGDAVSANKFHSFYALLTGASGAPVTISFERNTVETIVKSVTKTLTGAVTTWSNGTWGNFSWNTIKFALVKFFPSLLAFYGRYGLQNSNADQFIAVRAMSDVTQDTPLH